MFNLKVRDGHLPEFYANGILTHNCSISGEPVVKLLGIQPAGLNASSEGEITSWLDWCEAFREKFCAPQITTVVDLAQMSLFGAVDPNITWTWVNLRSLDPKEETEQQKVQAEMDATYIEAGVFDPMEIRQGLITDEESPYYQIDETVTQQDMGSGPEGAGIVDPAMAAEFPQLQPPEGVEPLDPSAARRSGAGREPDLEREQRRGERDADNPLRGREPRLRARPLEGAYREDDLEDVEPRG